LDKSAAAYEHFMRAALVDLEDVRGNASEGIHAASTGGVWQAVIFGFAGVHLTETGPVVKTPHLPPQWTGLKFKLNWRDRWHEFELSKTEAGTEISVISENKTEVVLSSEEWSKTLNEAAVPI
jgi:kojibiose phosphorylase